MTSIPELIDTADNSYTRSHWPPRCIIQLKLWAMIELQGRFAYAARKVRNPWGLLAGLLRAHFRSYY